MANIQVTRTEDTIQMLWHGTVTAQDIYQAFRQLTQLLRDDRQEMNLMVIVDSDTQLPQFDNYDGLPARMKHVRLRDSLIIGKNARVNHAISSMLSHVLPMRINPTY